MKSVDRCFDQVVPRGRASNQLPIGGGAVPFGGRRKAARRQEGSDFLGVVQAIQAKVEGGVWSDVERRRRRVDWWRRRGLASPVAVGKWKRSTEQHGMSKSPGG